MKNQPLVTIISVNYNQLQVTADMLLSLSKLDYTNYEVIVVDNASATPSAGLKIDFPFITHITLPVNTGFAGGNNAALPYAKGEYVLFLNNDTEVSANLLNDLVQYMQQNPLCGMACPKIKYYQRPNTIQYAGTVGPNLLTSRSHNIGYLQNDDGTYNSSYVTDQPNGAAMMVPMHLIKSLGPMSELFFLYYEELDWAARFKKAGYQVHYVGTTHILHKESVSTGKNSPFKTYYLYRNRLLYIRRNYRLHHQLISGGFFVAVSTPVHCIKHGLKGEWKHTLAILRALGWNMLHRAMAEPSILSVSTKNNLIVC